jgi:hypothetical protein
VKKYESGRRPNCDEAMGVALCRTKGSGAKGGMERWIANNGRMTTPSPNLFEGRHFDREIIVLCVRWYLSFKLSARDLVQMMNERGIGLAHTTILR